MRAEGEAVGIRRLRRPSNRRRRSPPDMESPAIAAGPAVHGEAWSSGTPREAHASLICAMVAESCAAAFAPRLRATVLTGSLARGGGQFQRTENGTLRLGGAD